MFLENIIRTSKNTCSLFFYMILFNKVGDILKVIIQRVKNAKVLINNKREENINTGFVVLVGFTHNDNICDIEYIKKKILSLRIFEDENNKMNYSLKDVNGSLLIISQFTLYADVRKGNRPSFNNSLDYNSAEKLYEEFINSMKKSEIEVKTGEFGADMLVTINNDGPVTIIIDSKEG